MRERTHVEQDPQQQDAYYHTPVLVQEILSYLPPEKDNPVVVDATLGEGGHSALFLERGCRVLAFDRDSTMIHVSQKRFAGDDRISLTNDTYDHIHKHLAYEYEGAVDLMLFDLGVSLYHFKGAQRGFSFNEDAPLDMRLSLERTLTAKDVVNTYEEDELVRVFRELGEIRYAGRIAEAILRARGEREIENVKDLENIVFHATPRKLRYGKTHPATRAFQALRIEVNDELRILEDALVETLPLLCEGGVLVVISYHSLEDRIVKRFFKEHDVKKGTGMLRPRTKNVITPSKEEVALNPRARSAKMRVAVREKTGDEAE